MCLYRKSKRKKRGEVEEGSKNSGQPAWIAEFSAKKNVEDEEAIARRIMQRRERVEANLQKQKLGSLVNVNGHVKWRNASKKRKMADPYEDCSDSSDYG